MSTRYRLSQVLDIVSTERTQRLTRAGSELTQPTTQPRKRARRDGLAEHTSYAEATEQSDTYKEHPTGMCI